MPCSLTVTGRRHAGVVLNVSPRGLFVQTRAKISPGESVEISLCAPTHAREIELSAMVVWRRMVPAVLVAVAQGGCGVRIQHATESFYEYLSTVLPPVASPA
jgi:Tfp pilus assembly protein PilZ